mgnify:CR=1 FL=1
MSWLPNPIACDVCGIVKQPSNNWYYGKIRPDVPTEDEAIFCLWPWDYPAEDRNEPFVHLCGQACAIRKLSEFMSPTPPPPNRQEPLPQARIQQQENQEIAQPQWTENGPIQGQNEI